MVPKFWSAMAAREICKSAATRDGLLKYHLYTFTARFIIFAYYVYALVLFIQCCITVLATFRLYICIYNIYISDNADCPALPNYVYIYIHTHI
jgi:hypothetical protein